MQLIPMDENPVKRKFPYKYTMLIEEFVSSGSKCSKVDVEGNKNFHMNIYQAVRRYGYSDRVEVRSVAGVTYLIRHDSI